MVDGIFALSALVLLGVTFSKRILNSRRWRATVTPLASIIGSGFLVAGPILAHAAVIALGAPAEGGVEASQAGNVNVSRIR
jgi:hypothetical protein